MIILGRKYKDKATGIEGVATAITEYQFGCRRVCIEKAGKDSDGNVCIMEYWFDEQRLTSKSKAKIGGPGNIPSKRSIPSKR